MASINHSAITDVDSLHDAYPRQVAGSPVGSLTPEFAYEVVIDSTNHVPYVATGTGINDWSAVSMGAREIPTAIAAPTYFVGSLNAGFNYVWSGLGASDAIGDTCNTSRTAQAPAWQGNQLTGRTGNNRLHAHVTWNYEENTGDSAPPTWQLFLKIPPEFTSWGSQGIRVAYETALSVGTDAQWTVSLEVMDPADFAAWSTPKKTTSVTYSSGVSDSDVVWLQIDGDTLGTDYSAGDIILVEVKLEKTNLPTGSTDEITFQIGRFEVFWSDA